MLRVSSARFELLNMYERNIRKKLELNLIFTLQSEIFMLLCGILCLSVHFTCNPTFSFLSFACHTIKHAVDVEYFLTR